MKYKNQIYQGKYPPIADMETYTKVQKILDLHNHGVNRRRKHRFLLSGLIFCNECGSRLIGEKHAKKSGLIFDYYRCMGPRHNEENCSQTFLPTQDIEEEVADLFKNVSLSDTLLKGLRFALEEVYAVQNQKDNQWVKTLENRRDGILKKMNRLEELLLEGVIAKERIIEKYQPLKDELDAVENQIKQNKTSGSKLNGKLSKPKKTKNKKQDPLLPEGYKYWARKDGFPYGSIPAPDFKMGKWRERTWDIQCHWASRSDA
jgi:site-specific DNA recombinase